MCSIKRFFSPYLILCLSSTFVLAADSDSPKETMQPGTVLHVQLDADAKMKPGAPVRGHILEPVYVANHLTIPQGSVVTGEVVDIVPASSKRRTAAKLQGDFTPLHEARVRFDHVRTSDGNEFSIETAPTQQG